MRRNLRPTLLAVSVSALLAAGAFATSPTASAKPVPAGAAVSATVSGTAARTAAPTRGQLERGLVARINTARKARGLHTLAVRDDLRRHARVHSAAMARRGYLFHTRDFNVICCWRSIGENVAYGYSATSIHRMFMNSSGHRANILSANKRHVGVGVRIEGDTFWVTEVFRQPS